MSAIGTGQGAGEGDIASRPAGRQDAPRLYGEGRGRVHRHEESPRALGHPPQPRTGARSRTQPVPVAVPERAILVIERKKR